MSVSPPQPRATEGQTAAATVGNTAKNAYEDDSDNESVASSTDPSYSEIWIVLANNLARDLKDVDLEQNGDMLVEQLKESSMRFGNDNPNEDHLRIMSIVYRHARYESLHGIMLLSVILFNSSFISNEIIDFIWVGELQLRFSVTHTERKWKTHIPPMLAPI